MFCTKCGKENDDDAVFCQKCGSAFVLDEDETRVASRGKQPLSTADPAPVFSITPTLKFVYLGYAIALVIAFVAAIVFGSLGSLTPPAIVVLGIILAIVALLIPAYLHLQKKLVRYTLTDTTIEIDRGLISRTTQNIPIRRIQDVTVSSTMVQRVLGFGDVIIDNASEDGGKVILRDIDSPKQYADLMLKQMRLIEK
ncbi:MAG: hypothetical protein DMF63_11535 [Acidobacteria bacterium]|nr:MAG: hypothetical protein DMF63_11535 [Acidobacteriota bacterium]